jgi:hypothetical protein
MCESDAGFLEELDVASTMQQEGSKNSRNIGSMSWYQVVQASSGTERHGCSVVVIGHDGMTKQCDNCGVEI